MQNADDIGETDIQERGLAIVDSHHHLWPTGQHAYRTEDFLTDINQSGGHHVSATVYIECSIESIQAFLRVMGRH